MPSATESESSYIRGSIYSHVYKIIRVFKPNAYETMFTELAHIEFENIYARYDSSENSPIMGEHASAWSRFSSVAETLLKGLYSEQQHYNEWKHGLEQGLPIDKGLQPAHPFNQMLLGLTEWLQKRDIAWPFTRSMRILEELYARKCFYQHDIGTSMIQRCDNSNTERPFINLQRLARLSVQEKAQIIAFDWMALEQNPYRVTDNVKARLQAKMSLIGGSFMYRISLREDWSVVNYHIRNGTNPLGMRINMARSQVPSRWEPVYRCIPVYKDAPNNAITPHDQQVPCGCKVVDELLAVQDINVAYVIHLLTSLDDVTLMRKWSRECNDGQWGGLRDEH